MSEQAHTPGPWTLRPRMGPVGSTAFGNGTQIVSGEVHVASVSSVADKPLDQKMADAHLIAAAPDLLAVAIKSHEPYEGLSDQDVIDLYGGREAELCLALRAAIARATPSKSGGK